MEREQGYRAELIEAGHMAALGLLTATVAHELRGPVGALVQLAEQQQIADQLRDLGPDAGRCSPISGELLFDMKAAAGQMSTLISAAFSLSRRETAPDKLELGIVARDGPPSRAPRSSTRNLAGRRLCSELLHDGPARQPRTGHSTWSSTPPTRARWPTAQSPPSPCAPEPKLHV